MTLNLLFVGDGPRDEAAVPRLVERILNVKVTAEFEPWKELHLHGSGRGLSRKLMYMLRRARDRSAAGVVATVDADKFANNKLAELRIARNDDRAKGHMTPAAIGEAIPHLEAWLIDDDVAVRTALKLPSTTLIEAPTKIKSPKDELNRICESCGIGGPIVQMLASIASALDVHRCARADYTGFEEFKQDVKHEIGALRGR